MRLFSADPRDREAAKREELRGLIRGSLRRLAAQWWLVEFTNLDQSTRKGYRSCVEACSKSARVRSELAIGHYGAG